MASVAPYVGHCVARQDRSDGNILLRSKLPIGPIATNTGEWLHHWAQSAPDRVFLMQRSGPGWRQITYVEMLQQVQALAASMLARNMGPDTPVVVLSGPGIDHAIVALAAQYIGVPLAPLAEQYSLIPEARARLAYCVGKINPTMVFAADGNLFGDALKMEIFDDVAKLVSINVPTGALSLETMLANGELAELAQAHATVGPDTLAKVLFTSGSTGNPKGVPQSQKMMTVNQAQYLSCLPMLGERPPVIVEWLPWNHVFAGNSDFNMILANGGTLILDDGKPVKGLFDRTLENLAMHVGTLSFNVPIAYAMLVEAFRKDRKLRHRFFSDLDLIFYAGASLPADLWTALEDMSREVTGTVPMMTSSWGLTETAPAGLIHHQGGAETGMIGVPVPLLDVKLLPYQDSRYEIRVKGPSVINAYFDEPEKTREAFDDEGYFITSDAVRFVDPDDMSKGVRFDGRITEDFKLLTGTWVQAAKIRLDVLAALEGLVQDVVVTGADRADLGLLIFPAPGKFENSSGGTIITDPKYCSEIDKILTPLARAATGSSNRIARALVMAQPPSLKDGEITAKGSLNIKAVLECRPDLLERLYQDDDAAVIKPKGMSND
ncbi:MAG: AMP-binding protein [Rhizobiaceae bacterium]|nr:AMP-binding protein [Rhizobiaceae bacterium]